MRISADHRTRTKVYDPASYQRLADAFVESLQACGVVRSLVICGSVVKDDVVPGWSDLDLVVIMRSPDGETAAVDLGVLASAMRRARGDIEIGVGADVVLPEELEPEGRLGGRPLAMSYEVSRYGRVAFGPSPFDVLPPLAAGRARVLAERPLLVRAEIHNWRRARIAAGDARATSPTWGALTVKTMLKLLKHVVEPDTVHPYTHASYLELLSHRQPESGVFLDAARLAVQTRRDWIATVSDQDALRRVVLALEPVLAAGSVPLGTQ